MASEGVTTMTDAIPTEQIPAYKLRPYDSIKRKDGRFLMVDKVMRRRGRADLVEVLFHGLDQYRSIASGRMLTIAKRPQEG